jgi:hypothetical protein
VTESDIDSQTDFAATDLVTVDGCVHGPAEHRRYTYEPTYILRGLTDLHLRFTPRR